MIECQWYTVIEVPAKSGLHIRRGIHAFGISPDEHDKIKKTGIPMRGGKWNDYIKLYVFPTGAKNGPDVAKKAQELGFPNEGIIYTKKGKFLR